SACEVNRFRATLLVVELENLDILLEPQAFEYFVVEATDFASAEVPCTRHFWSKPLFIVHNSPLFEFGAPKVEHIRQREIEIARTAVHARHSYDGSHTRVFSLVVGIESDNGVFLHILC